jgi:hypothetical protein
MAVRSRDWVDHEVLRYRADEVVGWLLRCCGLLCSLRLCCGRLRLCLCLVASLLFCLLGGLGLRLRSCRGPRLCLSLSRGHRLCPGLCLCLRLGPRYRRSLHLIAGLLHDCVFYFISTFCSTRHRSLHQQGLTELPQLNLRRSALLRRFPISFEDSRVLTGPSALPQPPCIK